MPNHRRLTDEQEAIIAQEYGSGESAPKLAKKWNVCDALILKASRKFGVPIRTAAAYERVNKLTSEDKIEAVRMYNEGRLTIAKIAAHFNVSHRAIGDLLKRRHVQIRTISESCRIHSVNEAAFDPDPETGLLSDDQMYWLGILLSDGNLSIDKSSPHSGKIQLGFKLPDIKHIEAFKEFLKAEHPIQIRPAKTNRNPCDKTRYRRPFIKSQATANIAIQSARLAQAVLSLGVVPRKSRIAKILPHLESAQNVRCLFRGLVDGDGWVSVANNGTSNLAQIGLTGTQAICQSFEMFAKKIFPDCEATARRGTSIWLFTTSGDPAAAIIKDLYRPGEIALERKAVNARLAIEVQEEIQRIRQAKDDERALRWECTIEDCDRKAVARGLCKMHHHRLMRYGRTERIRQTWDHLTAEELLKLRSQSKSWNAVARHLGIYRAVLQQVRRRLGIL